MRTPLLAAVLALGAAPAFAQVQRPLPPAAVDLRGFYTALTRDPITAADLGVTTDDMPARGLGGVAGLHVYPIRRQGFAIGVGGEAIAAFGRAQRTDERGEPVGPLVRQRLLGLSGAVSLNFGHRDGWSYLTAGMGPFRLESFTGDTAPDPPQPSKSTINLGGGARWFTRPHVAFTIDVRFYLIRPELTTELGPGRERRRLLVLSAGVAFK